MKIIDFIFAARPMLLLPVWSVYLISFKMTGNAFARESFMSLIGLTLIFAGAYYINQIFDYESDLINNKLGFLQKKMISQTEMTAAYIVVTLLGLTACFYASLYVGIIGAIIFVIGLLYSVPPFRLKDRSVLGLFSNSIAYGMLVPLAALGSFDLIADANLAIVRYMYLMITAGYLLTIIPDKDGDEKTGKKTLAVSIGKRPIIALCFLLIAATYYSVYILSDIYLLAISSISLMLSIIALIKPSPPIILISCKIPILLFSLLAGYFFPAYLFFLIVLIVLTRLYYKKRFGIVYPQIG